MFPLTASQAALKDEDTLILSEQPMPGHESGHGQPGKRGNGQGHAEHRAASERTWYLNRHDLHPGAEVVILRPDTCRAEGSLSHGKDGWTFVVDTKPLDGSLDGVFNLYVIDHSLSGGIMTVRAPKANMINHSCGWGHTFKFNQDRLRPKNNRDIPLEIVAENLWDRNFHSKTMSGDKLLVQVLQSGEPAADATVSFTTSSGWTKTVLADEDGKASIQLIRDYYPETWSLFDARKQGTILVTAVVETPEKGVYQEKAYSRTRLVATLPWRYAPRRSEYTSFAYGLGITALFAVTSGAGIYAYRERRKRPVREVTFDERS
jgi:hypothetical protein